MKWMMCALLVCSSVVAEDEIVIVNQQVGVVRLRCLELEIKIEAISDKFLEIDLSIANKHKLIDHWNQMIKFTLDHEREMKRKGESIPPGVKIALDTYREYIRELSQEIRDLEKKRDALRPEWADLWLQYESEGC
jgi:DNA mismatch repair ATPase MutS